MRKLVIAAAFSLTACAGFGPGLSVRDPSHFAAPPVIVHSGDEYLITWTQADYPFFFRPDYEPMNGGLAFSAHDAASSGDLVGASMAFAIEGEENIRALQRGGAYWWQVGQGGTSEFVRLEVREVSN
ncbi:MAG: hypothetical protein IPK60_00100 [Sandaracinaceae bacterium]|nr:hypothetical protein [Sandaracinaceae bacterium]